MANLFPDLYPTIWKPKRTPYQARDRSADGYMQINTYDPVDEFSAHGEWNQLLRTQLNQIEAHRNSYKDTSFGLFDPHFTTATGVFVAIATGATNVYTLPGKLFTAPVILHNGAVLGTQPTISAGTGEDGQTQIVYAANPGAAIVITVNATDCRRWYEVFYDKPEWEPEHGGADIWSVKFDFIQKVVA